VCPFLPPFLLLVLLLVFEVLFSGCVEAIEGEVGIRESNGRGGGRRADFVFGRSSSSSRRERRRGRGRGVGGCVCGYDCSFFFRGWVSAYSGEEK
jgi:hypothetical protein